MIAAAPIGPCPRCHAPVVARVREFACSAACGFTMRNRVAGRAISGALAGVLLQHRRSQLLRGFRSKAGKPFAATLVLDDSGELRFDFSNNTPSSTRRRKARTDHPPARDLDDARADNSRPDLHARPSRPDDSADALAGTSRARRRGSRRKSPSSASAPLTCPRCREGALIAGARGWGCSRWRDGCRFVVWFETAGRRLSTAQLRDLVTRGRTRKTQFLTDRGELVDGRLVLDPTLDGGSPRFEPAR